MKALRVILFAVLMLPAERVWSAAMTTLTNFNAVYFLVDADPTAIPTNVVLLTGNLTNWQKLTTNIVGTLTINPTDLYVPYRSSATAFSDSYFLRLSNEMYATNATLRVARTGSFNDDGLAAQTFTVWGVGKNRVWQSLDDHAWLQLNVQSIIGESDPYNSHGLTLWNLAASDPASASPSENSLSLDWIGSAWSTNQAASRVIAFSAWAKGNAAANDPTGTWVLESKVGTGAMVTNLTVASGADYHIPAGNWDDSQVPEAMVRVGATAPTLANFNGGPVQTLQFQNNRDDTIMATVQMTHRWKQGTDIHPHVHWCETAATGAGTNVVWQLTYAWTNIGCAYPAYTTLKITNSVTGTNWFSQLSDFPDISGTNKLVSSIFVFELRRLANSATADDYNQNVAFLGFDIHHQVNSPGSDNELTKSF